MDGVDHSIPLGSVIPHGGNFRYSWLVSEFPGRRHPISYHKINLFIKIVLRNRRLTFSQILVINKLLFIKMFGIQLTFTFVGRTML
jgi:hypothetical protein